MAHSQSSTLQGNRPLKDVDFESAMQQLKACLERVGVRPGASRAAEQLASPATPADTPERRMARQQSFASFSRTSPTNSSPVTGRVLQLVRRVMEKLRQAGWLQEDAARVAQLVRRVGLAVHAVDAELSTSALRSQAMEEALLVWVLGRHGLTWCTYAKRACKCEAHACASCSRREH